MRLSSALLLDRFLRSRDWHIHSRPKSGPVLWRKGNAVLPQEQAIKIAMKERDNEQIPQETSRD